MSYVPSLLSVSSIMLLGFALLLFLRPRLGGSHPLEWIPVLFATGCLVVAGWGLAQLVLLTTIHPLVLTIPGAAAVMWALRRARTVHVALPPWSPGRIAAAAIGAVAALRLATILLASMDHHMGWDGVFYWGLRAKLLLYPELEYFGDPLLQYTNPHYPLLLPALDAWTYQWAGSIELRAVKWISPIALAASCLMVYLGLRSYWGPPVSAVFALATILPAPATENALLSFADLLQGTFYVGAVVYGSRYVRSLDTRNLLPMSLFLAAGILTKKEGELLALSLVAGLGLALFMGKTRYLRRAAATVAAVLAPTYLPWLLFQQMVPPLAYGYWGIDSSTLARAATRVPEIVDRMEGQLTWWQEWGPAWLAPALTLLFFPERWLRRETVFLVVSIVAPLVLYAAAYAFSVWPSAAAHMDTSLSRLLLHLLPASLFAAGAVSSPIAASVATAEDL